MLEQQSKTSFFTFSQFGMKVAAGMDLMRCEMTRHTSWFLVCIAIKRN